MKFSCAFMVQQVCIILVSNFMINSAHASWQCSDLTQNFCHIDKSSRNKQFCQHSSKQTYEGYLNCDGQFDGKGTYSWPSGQLYKGE